MQNREEKNGRSVKSLGDSYAFGIAGTGGTTSPLAELWIGLGFGVGSLEVDWLWLSRCGCEPAEVLAELKLLLEDDDIPEP